MSKIGAHVLEAQQHEMQEGDWIDFPDDYDAVDQTIKVSLMQSLIGFEADSSRSGSRHSAKLRKTNFKLKE